MNQKAHQFFIVYDGIANSVFMSQVVQPLINHKQTATIVSFEHTPEQARQKAPTLPPSITLIILKKISFFGQLSLHYAARQLAPILAQQQSYRITARGPLAGWICLRAARPSNCKQLTIQARGLVADEYRYAHADATGIAHLLHRFRAWQYESIEHAVFGINNTPFNLTIEAVSSELKNYLVTHFGARKQKISVAHLDLVPPLSPQEKEAWRKKIREELAIDNQTLVYCYNGSAKPWQCPELVISYFKNKHSQQDNALLLILSQDEESFKKLLQKDHLAPHQYRLLPVPHNKVIPYLAAADVGLLFREPHIINWVSRPTKVLEYHAAHLVIEHNNSVAWVIKREYL